VVVAFEDEPRCQPARHGGGAAEENLTESKQEHGAPSFRPKKKGADTPPLCEEKRFAAFHPVPGVEPGYVISLHHSNHDAAIGKLLCQWDVTDEKRGGPKPARPRGG
jgi:hypothetical protein